MKTVKLNFFEVFSLGWMTLSFFSLCLAITGFFHFFWLIFFLATIIFGFFYLVKKRYIQIIGLERSSWIILTIICSLGIFLSLFSIPTIFGGRDEGSYSTSGLLISQNHQTTYSDELTSQFFRVYGPGKALNFPGFYYQEDGSLKSQFLPAYPSWIAIWHSFFGLPGLKFANLFPFVTFLFSFYLILKIITAEFHSQRPEDKKYPWLPILGSAMLTSVLPLIILYKFTLGEIYFAALLWFSIYLFLKYFKESSGFRYGMLFIPLAILPFVRIEAAAFLFMFLLLFILKDYEHLKLPRYQLPFVILAFIFLTAFAYEPNFFIDSLGNVAEPLLEKEAPLSEEDSFLSDDWKNFYNLRLFHNYNLAPFFIFTGVFLLNFLRKKEREKIKGKSKLFLLPFVFSLPTLIYLFDANISLDHPWYFRRFIFMIIPMTVLYAALFLYCLRSSNRWLFRIIVLLIISLNILLLFPVASDGQPGKNLLTFGQNQHLLTQIEELSNNFSDKDLLLISQRSSGSGWSLMSEPLRTLFGKQAVYFFNPYDLGKIERSKFENVYLISSASELSLYEKINKKEIKRYTLENTIIDPSRDPEQKPRTVETKTEIIIFQVE
jgi:hypothetical protein